MSDHLSPGGPGTVPSDETIVVDVDALNVTPGALLAVNVGGCVLTRLPSFVDDRGKLLPLQGGRGLPFTPMRIFSVYEVRPDAVRGEHAHLACEQFLYVLGGSVSVIVDDGRRRAQITLDHPTIGLHIPPNVWGVQHRFSANAALMVAASMPYDPADYVTDYQQFLALMRDG